VKFQGQMLWIATLAILLQSVLNCEVIRYALATGEPIFTGYLRCRPGPRFWSVIYFISDIGIFFPAFAGALAQLLVAAYLGEGNPVTQEHNSLIMGVGIGVVSEIEFIPDPALRAVVVSDAEMYTHAHVVCLEERRGARLVKAFLDIVGELQAERRPGRPRKKAPMPR